MVKINVLPLLVSLSTFISPPYSFTAKLQNISSISVLSKTKSTQNSGAFLFYKNYF
ncbi:MAG: hypothetical protein M0Q46_04830 [Endomicrobiales bacterium]|nr:hypothetical protein [Endomicrobiales bacterium]